MSRKKIQSNLADFSTWCDADFSYPFPVRHIYPRPVKLTPSNKVAQWGFQGQNLPHLSINYVAINKDFGKFPPHLYKINMKICFDRG